MKKDTNQNSPLGAGGKQIPILFSTPMVQAIMDGRKTITRRLITQHNSASTEKLANLNFEEVYLDGGNTFIKDNYLKVGHKTDGTCHRVFSRIAEGDILWVRESFSWDWKDYPERTEKYYFYKASTPGDFLASGEHWKPSIHMPKAACRIWLQVTKVRAERLHNITEEDAKAEGVLLHKTGTHYLNYTDEKAGLTQFIYNCRTAAQSFKTLWVLINGFRDEPAAWFKNPWVWVIEFKVLSTTGKPSIIHNS